MRYLLGTYNRVPNTIALKVELRCPGEGGIGGGGRGGAGVHRIRARVSPATCDRYAPVIGCTYSTRPRNLEASVHKIL